jgi:predicted proteasome-type protease
MKNILSFSSFNEEKGGLSSGMNLEDLAKKHSVSLDDIKSELEMGMKVELEHTEDEDMTRKIAMDHLAEDPMYYTKLKDIEKK